ncbi:MAG: D-lyxose/D-mannose family sugar isomerase [Rhodothermales bacterium]
MKRSDINRIIESAEAFLKERQFVLPPFAYWTPDVWRGKGAEVARIVDRRLGWDITDFGSGDFRSVGLFLFTIRNGDPADLGSGRGMLYGEKILIVEPDQVTPLHRHKVKTEDIINRGGGNLAVKLFDSSEDGELADGEVVVFTDGVRRTVPPGGTIILEPGESITLPDGTYHAFWGVNDRVLVGEVSLVNDDETDNYFYEPAGRFPDIVEDDAPRYLLVNDYERYVARRS